MKLIDSFDIYEDFYSDSQLRTIFATEAATIPSKHMWALLLYYHPKSKYYELSPQTKAQLIATDYLEVPSFDFDAYPTTVEKINRHILTRPQRFLTQWDAKLEERYQFIALTPYNMENLEILDKMMAASHKLWKEYKEIRDAFLKEDETKTHGAVVESLSEQGII